MNTYKLFLDDTRMPLDVYKYSGNQIYFEYWVIVRSYDEFVQKVKDMFEIQNAFPNIISFDHDLQDEHYHPDMFISDEAYDRHRRTFKEKTGLECAKWFLEFCEKNKLELPTIFVHTMNPVGRPAILNVFNNQRRT